MFKFLLLIACLISISNALSNPFPTNIALGRPVSISCPAEPCSYQDTVPPLILDGDNATLWRSPPLTEVPQAQIYIDLLQEFALLEVSVSFPSFLPTEWSVEISADNSTFSLVRNFSTDCPAVSNCTQIGNVVGPLMVEISLNTALDTRARFVRINLLSLLSEDYNRSELFYSLSEVSVLGACSCNGYARECYADTPNLYRCRCQENTCGRHCESCCEGFQLLEYTSRREDPSFKCKVCDNCTVSLIKELDTHTADFNTTAEEFDSLILTIPSLLTELESLNDNFSSLLSATQVYISVTSSLELAVYGTYADYTTEVDVPTLECVPQVNSSISQLLDEFIEHHRQTNITVNQLSFLADGFSAMVSSQEESILNISMSVTAANASLQERYRELYSSLADLRDLSDEAEAKLTDAKRNLSTIISNHKFITQILQESELLSSHADNWYRTVTSLLSYLAQHKFTAVELHTSLLSLSYSILRHQGTANTSLTSYQQLVRDKQVILDLFSNTTSLNASIITLGGEIEILIAEIERSFERIRVITVSIEMCLERLNAWTLELSVRNSELTEYNSDIENELKTFLNTTNVESADNYTLKAEIYTKELIQISSEIVSLVRTVPNTSIALPLTELQLQVAIGSALRIVSLRNRLIALIKTIRGDNIFSEIANLSRLNEMLITRADLLISEATAVVNSIWPYNARSSRVGDELSRLNGIVDGLLTLVGFLYEDDEYTSVLSELRSALEANRSALSAQEPAVNSTISELVSVQTLIPNITRHNNASTQLRDSMLPQLSDAEDRSSSISSALASLRNKTSTIKSRNSKLLSRLERVYSRLNRVHTELQLPKAPLRLDGSMVVSLQPPPTEQLDNVSYSSDYSFYFEPVRDVLTDSGATSFLFFYAGPAVLNNSTNTSVLGTDDFIAIVAVSDVMGYRARIGGTDFSGDLSSVIRSNNKYRIRIKRVGSAFRFSLKSATAEETLVPSISSGGLHNFLFRSSSNTAYYIGGFPDDVMIANSLQSLKKFRGCVYLALTLRSNLYSLWDTRYHTNLLTDQTGLDCVRHSETQTDFDVVGLSFNGYGHAYVNYQSITPIIRLQVTPQRANGLILTAFGTNGDGVEFIFSFYLRDGLFNFDVSHGGGSRQTLSSNTPALISVQYEIKMSLSSPAQIEFTYKDSQFFITTELNVDLYSANVLLFGGISELAVDESNGRLANWTTDYYTNYVGCITDIVILRTPIVNSLVSSGFDFNSGGTTGVSLGCPIVPIPEYSVTKTGITGYISYTVLAHQGEAPTTFNHEQKNYELFPNAIGGFGANPVDFTVPYSLSLIVSKPEFVQNRTKAVLIHLKDSAQSLEISIDSSLNVTLEVTRNGGTESVSSPLDLSRSTRIHVITVYSMGTSAGLNLFVDDSPPVTLSGDFSLQIRRELTNQHQLFVGGNENGDYSFKGCLKEVALHDSLLNLGIGNFVPTGESPADSQGVEHDMCGVHPYNGILYGGARALQHPFNYPEAIESADF